MNKKMILTVGILLLLAIAGCSGGSIFGKKNAGKNPISDVDVRKGTTGLEMSFIPNAPPDKIFEDGVFPLYVNIKNSGAADINEGVLVFGLENAFVDVDEGELKNLPAEKLESLVSEEIKKIELNELDNVLLDALREGILKGGGSPDDAKLMEGFEEMVFALLKFGTEGDPEKYRQRLIEVLKEIKVIQNIKINGKSIYNPQGDQDFKQLNAKAKKIGPQSETHTSTIFATACYPYDTIFGTSACIDTDIIGERKGQKVCVIKDMTFGDGQGAPVAVTKVETRMLPRDDGKIMPSFIIEVENKGTGEVIDSDKVKEVCGNSALKYTDFNTLKVRASLSDTPLKCGEDGKGIMRLKDKKDVTRCTLESVGIDTSLNAYTTPLKVELNYGYTFTISKNIIIEKVLTH